MNPTSAVTATQQQPRDVHAPAAPGFWPPAPGWWLLAIMLLLALLVAGRQLYRYYQLRRYRHRLLNLLSILQNSGLAVTRPAQFAAEISMLLRRVALTRFPPQQVATLNGHDWLQFLDATGGHGRFCNGAGQVLADGPYRPDIELNARELLALAHDWIRRNS
jgi:hypothetical protein